MILCDTNILIEFYKGNPEIIQTLRTIGPTNIAVSVITKAELFYGARDKQELAKIERHLGQCHCYGLNPAISSLFIDLMRRYSLSHKASVPDMLITATAISHDVALYTLNTKDFKFIPDLNLYL
ncbi:type II toxin-antitoxin system VapC family toxin [Methylomonas sp. OY6]|jgi:tRNA(fMet)-specific endonuclease VapC|uniref:Type II toxin-antitoxin system VapC family toxin n=1 Tax=Methylomonas defluvii TaxID=3045149 RepID=A0ABU4UKF1_9GAMM|nr:type II toxin-antitoxin system VapC family toxin [Methylomonas sp. OY6]MDX8129994.1 type II toxin-antitoxin system VapC family toxin [Methylomonas sp. OY6]